MLPIGQQISSGSGVGRRAPSEGNSVRSVAQRVQRWAVRAGTAILLGVLLTLGQIRASMAGTEARWAQCGVWTHVAPPRTVYGFPRDIEVVSPSQAWFVGWKGFVAGGPVIWHWKGVRWEHERFPTPDDNQDDVDVADLAVTTSGAVWGVGHANRVAGDSAGLRPLAARWTGGRWRRVPVEIPRRASFNAVAPVPGTKRLWAVGSYGLSTWGAGGNGTFVARWNGKRWHRVPSPSLGHTSAFMDVTVAGTKVWAVGSFRRSGVQRTFAARWSSGRWTVYRGSHGGLQGIGGTQPRVIWGVGPGKDVEPQRALLRRWDGGSWSTVRRAAEPSALLDVAVVSRTDAWAVGYHDPFPSHPLLMRRHGGPWHRVPAPHVSGQFSAIAGTPNNLWALRYHVVGDSGRLDTFHRC